MLPTLMFDALLNAAHGNTTFAWGPASAFLMALMAWLTLLEKDMFQYLNTWS